MTDCILTQNKIQKTGYTFMTYKGKTIGTHRISYEILNGPVPKGLVVDHTCGNRACVAPNHLRAVTQQKNIMAGKHNRDNRDTCPQGHLNTLENTMVRKDGKRECSECNRERARVVYARKKANA